MPTMTPDQELTTLLEETLAIAERLAGKTNRMDPEIREDFDREWQRLAEAVPRVRQLLPRVREQAVDEGLVSRVAKAEDLLDRLETQLAGIRQEVLERKGGNNG